MSGRLAQRDVRHVAVMVLATFDTSDLSGRGVN